MNIIIYFAHFQCSLLKHNQVQGILPSITLHFLFLPLCWTRTLMFCYLYALVCCFAMVIVVVALSVICGRVAHTEIERDGDRQSDIHLKAHIYTYTCTHTYIHKLKYNWIVLWQTYWHQKRGNNKATTAKEGDKKQSAKTNADCMTVYVCVCVVYGHA